MPGGPGVAAGSGFRARGGGLGWLLSDLLHGPYAEWTRKIAGKTVTRRLTDAELAAWQPLFDNARNIRKLVAELQELTLQAIGADDQDKT